MFFFSGAVPLDSSVLVGIALTYEGISMFTTSLVLVREVALTRHVHTHPCQLRLCGRGSVVQAGCDHVTDKQSFLRLQASLKDEGGYKLLNSAVNQEAGFPTFDCFNSCYW